MIGRHYNLSCYALEHPYQAYLCQSRDIIELIDANNDIYQFRLPDCEHYERLEANWRVKQYFRINCTSLILYQTKQFYILNQEEPPVIIQNVKDVAAYLTKQAIQFILGHEDQENGPSLATIVTLVVDQKGTTHRIDYRLSKVSNFSNDMQHYESPLHENKQIEGIYYLFGQYCLLKNVLGGYLLARFLPESLCEPLMCKEVQYEVFNHVELPENIQTIGRFKNTLLFFTSQKQTNNTLYLLNADEHQLVPFAQFQTKAKRVNYLIYHKFLLLIDNFDLLVFEIVKGTLLTKVNIIAMLQEFEPGSSIILGVQQQKSPRYYLLFDHLAANLTHFYLMDKEKVSVFAIDLEEFINLSFKMVLKDSISDLQADHENIHQNVIKTMNFRIKKLSSLQQYMAQALKNLSFGNVFRFLQNQSNIFVLNDGLFLVFNALIQHLQRVTKQKVLALQIQRQMIKFSLKLVVQSKYEDHIVKGLTIANRFFVDFRSKYRILTKIDNIELYNKLLETKRVIKLLRQQKNKHLFELCYQLAIAVKGYEYVQEIEKQKK